MPHTEIKARLTLRNKQEETGTFQEMNALRNRMIRNGYPPLQLHVGYAVAKGTFYCKACGEIVKDPENDFYEGHEFWRCKCKQINYIS
jgi:hypothetical protein